VERSGPGINADNFSARWTGQVLAPKSEYFTFYTQSNDGVRLWVNGVKLVDNWTNHSVVENSGGLWLTAGQRYSITMEYYDSSGEAVARLLWSAPGLAKATIPQSQLFPSTSNTTPTPTPSTGDGLMAVYFNNADLTGTTATRIDRTVNFDWGTSAPISNIASDSFSVRWTGMIQPQHTQTYTFYAQTDDGVRLWINNQLIINRWVDQGTTESTGTISLSAGVKYSIKMEYYDGWGGAVARLYWSSSSTPKQIVPQSQLSSGSAVEVPEAVADGTDTDSSSFDGDSDRDGFSDELEVSLGTSPTDAASTPLQNLPAGDAKALQLKSLQLKLNFKQGGRDNILATGMIDASLEPSLQGMNLSVSVGGVAATFELNAKGFASNENGSVKLKRLKGTPAYRYEARLSGEFTDSLADEELSGTQDAFGEPRTVETILLFDRSVYKADPTLIYSARSGRTGKAFIKAVK
jgi:hypothetical protein